MTPPLEELRHGFAHVEKFSLNFSNSPFVIRVNLDVKYI